MATEPELGAAIAAANLAMREAAEAAEKVSQAQKALLEAEYAEGRARARSREAQDALLELVRGLPVVKATRTRGAPLTAEQWVDARDADAPHVREG